MFKLFKNKNKAWKSALYGLIVGIILILLIFAIINIKPIFSYVNGIVNAMSAFIYGFVLAFLCNPVYKKIHKYVFKFIELKAPHPKLRVLFSILTTYLIFAGIIALIIFAILPDIRDNYQELTENIEFYATELVKYARELLVKMGVEKPDEALNEYILMAFDALKITTGTPDLSADTLVLIYDTLISYATSMLTSIGPQIFQVMIGFILSVYFLIYKDSILVKGKRILCSLFPQKVYDRIIHFSKYTNETFGKYIIGTICDAVLVGCVVTLVLAIFKFPYPALIGLICGVTNVIPFFGPFIGAIPSGVLIFLTIKPEDTGSDMDSLTYKIIGAAIFALIILVIQQIDGNIIAPHILGESTGLTPIAVIAAITFCGHVFGPLGMLIGVPTCAVIAYMFNCFVEWRLKKKKLPTSLECYELGIDVHNTDFQKIYAENDFTQEIDLKQMTDTFSKTSTMTVNVPIQITKVDPNEDSADDNE